MHVIGLYVHPDYLDIVMESLKMAKYGFGILFESWNEDIATISRGPNDMIFSFIDGVRTSAKSHTRSVSWARLDRPLHHQTESDVFRGIIKTKLYNCSRPVTAFDMVAS